MDLRSTMLTHLASARRVVADGSEVIPSWRVATADGEFLTLTRYDPSEPEQAQRALRLVRGFMAWKMAIAFVMSAETWLASPGSGEEAVIAIGVSRSNSAR